MKNLYNNDKVSVCYKNACVHTQGQAAKVITWLLVGTVTVLGLATVIKNLSK